MGGDEHRAHVNELVRKGELRTNRRPIASADGVGRPAPPARRANCPRSHREARSHQKFSPEHFISLQLCPPSAETSTCRMLPLPDHASPETRKRGVFGASDN